ncbi:cytochrome c biogenesis protein CcsA [Pseudomarimonas salicorniae]|uniref:Cytochrome c biogenesis protein CcsA n=1 Tax=Pseudomarimonas salicorniae TaxID=2933270 RepID=A0ABT0GLN6_9GAMM|nr:cytochrome c biogenesis protein CcsA [Lysobacter sp. CAU 1642]MCK7595420.1 cytochrome c biogenesis protein CcsA [Lysobacter sp. CAU 1642]
MTLLLPAIAAIALYGLASWRLGRAAPEHSAALPLGLGLLAVLLHAAVHALDAYRSQSLPLHFFSALSWVALGMAALSTGVAWNRRFEALGSLVYPLAALALLAFILLPSARAPDVLDWPLRLHALLALLAYATLAVTAALAVLLAGQEHLLRRRRLDHPLLQLLPPLTELEALMFRTLAAGFLLLTLALTIGAVFVEDLFAQHLVHKTVLSVLSWTVFGALLFGRMRWGWRGRRAVRLTLAAMALLLLAFFGSKFVLELVLGRGA